MSYSSEQLALVRTWYGPCFYLFPIGIAFDSFLGHADEFGGEFDADGGAAEAVADQGCGAGAGEGVEDGGGDWIEPALAGWPPAGGGSVRWLPGKGGTDVCVGAIARADLSLGVP